MPELPEIETITRGIQTLINQQVLGVIVRQPKLRYLVDPELNATIINQRVTTITRRAKYIIMQLNSNNISSQYLIWHLGMSGSITMLQNSHPLKKHDHVDIIFENVILRYNDPRRFGCLILTNNIQNHPLLINLGPEPLTTQFNANYLMQKIHNKKTSIKQLIMNNQIVVGVGNIYACEALFNARISPLRSGESITLTETKQLVCCIKEVLIIAIKLGGSSISDYRKSDGTLGYFQQKHNVYGKSEQKCKACNDIILEHRLGQRNSFYCPSCQV